MLLVVTPNHHRGEVVEGAGVLARVEVDQAQVVSGEREKEKQRNREREKEKDVRRRVWDVSAAEVFFFARTR